MLIASAVTVRNRSQTLLDAVDFTAAPGQVTAIIGPSGAGKTTLLAALTGDHGHNGRVTLNGLDVADAPRPALAQMRAVLAQSTPLAFPFTVLEVVRLGLVNTPGQDTIARQALARVGLAGFEPRYYQELSGGEQQRVQLARVLSQVWNPVSDAGAPRWLFLDEPVSSLDIGHQIQVIGLVRDFARQGGGVVLVMHDLNLTTMCADSVALLKSGQMLLQDTPETVFNNRHLGHAYDCVMEVGQVPDKGTFVLPQMVVRATVKQAALDAGTAVS
ncbi:heme ABC transporter ATP-binding protein [Lutimaribacter marinistellae]|uniref:Heme ABC transporter ATP-binding protein n=1 Tax=Lutimaribacter marinistellae TaxID=1820329 RepID=A0ABV7TB67_9RHOB